MESQPTIDWFSLIFNGQVASELLEAGPALAKLFLVLAVAVVVSNKLR